MPKRRPSRRDVQPEIEDQDEQISNVPSSSQQRRQSRRTSPYLTAETLQQRLRTLGTPFPPTWGRKTLLQLYKAHTTASHSDSEPIPDQSRQLHDGLGTQGHQTTPFGPPSATVSVPPCVPDTVPQVGPTADTNIHPINATLHSGGTENSAENMNLGAMVKSLNQQVQHLTSLVQYSLAQHQPSHSIMQGPDVQTSPLNQPSTSSNPLIPMQAIGESGMQGAALFQPVASDSLPPIDLVPDQLITTIKAGKYVNLAFLLNTVHDLGDKPDPALSNALQHRVLSPREFTKAFRIFRNIYAADNAVMKASMEAYEEYVMDLAAQYEGDSFYEYHKRFAMRVAAYAAVGKQIDWAKPDITIFNSCCANRKRRACLVCNSISHLTAQCPSLHAQTRQPRFSEREFSAYRTRDQDSKGRPRMYINNKEVCNNFNEQQGCQRERCSFIHSCLTCHASSHGQSTCRQNKGKVGK